MNKLYRSRVNRVVGGVIGGIAELYHLDASLLRIIFVAATLFTLGIPGVILYFIAMAIIPEGPEAQTPPQ